MTEDDWNVPINDKWATVYIYSDRKVEDRDLRYRVIMATENSFGWTGCTGNGRKYREMINALSGFPKYDGEGWAENTLKPWQREHGIMSTGGGDASVFQSDLISSSYIGGPYSFLHLKDGTIHGCHNIGKFVGNVRNVRDQLEEFAQLFPEVDVNVAFSDGSETGRRYIVAVYHLFGGMIFRMYGYDSDGILEQFDDDPDTECHYYRFRNHARTNSSWLYYASVTREPYGYIVPNWARWLALHGPKALLERKYYGFASGVCYGEMFFTQRQARHLIKKYIVGRKLLREEKCA